MAVMIVTRSIPEYEKEEKRKKSIKLVKKVRWGKAWQ